MHISGLFHTYFRVIPYISPGCSMHTPGLFFTNFLQNGNIPFAAYTAEDPKFIPATDKIR